MVEKRFISSWKSQSDDVIKLSFKDEYLKLLRRNEIKYEDAYLFEFYE